MIVELHEELCRESFLHSLLDEKQSNLQAREIQTTLQNICQTTDLKITAKTTLSP